jgi:cytochrome c553
VLLGILLGVVIIPVVQGRSAGIDAYTAICRALGILPGSPAQQQVLRPHAADARFAGGVDALPCCKHSPPRDPNAGRAKVQEVCVACHGEDGVSAAPENPHLAGQSGAAIYKQLNDYRPAAGRISR